MGTRARAEQVAWFGALAMLLASAGLGGAGAGSGGPSGSALRAHANAGSVGWTALGVLAVALAMIRSDVREASRDDRVGIWLAWLSVGAVAASVWAGAVGSATALAVTVTVVLAAVAAFLAWLVRSGERALAGWTVPRLGVAAALVVLTAGFVLGALAAWMTVDGDATEAANVAAAQAAIAVSFVLLAATAVAEWTLLPPPSAPAAAPTTAGVVQVGVFVLAAVATVGGVLSSNLALTETNTSLVLAGIAIFGVRVGPRLLAAGWARGGRVWLAACGVALAVDAGLFVHVVFEVGVQRYASAGQVPSWLVFAVDHVTFVGVGTTALLGAIAVRARPDGRWPQADAVAVIGLTLGLAGIALGLGVGSTAAEAVSGVVLGLSILAAAAVAGLRVAGLASPR